MPTPRTSDEVLLETLAAFERNDRSYTLAGREIGINESSTRRRIQEAKLRGLHLSEGGREAMHGARLNGMEIGGGYRHVYSDDGKKLETVRWSAPKQELALETVLERATSAFSALPKAPAIPAPKRTASELLMLYPLFDVHYGMRAWGEETGGPDYDVKLAASDLNNAVGKAFRCHVW